MSKLLPLIVESIGWFAVGYTLGFAVSGSSRDWPLLLSMGIAVAAFVTRGFLS